MNPSARSDFTWSLLTFSYLAIHELLHMDKMQSIMDAYFCELMPSIVRMILSFNSSSNLFFCDFVLKGKKKEGERL